MLGRRKEGRELMGRKKTNFPQTLALFETEVREEKQIKTKMKRVKGQPTALKGLLSNYETPQVNKYISKEFQDYGYRLACELGEEAKKSLYIKLAQVTDRVILERARSYVLDAPKVRSKGKLFMWALKRLKEGKNLGESKAL